MGFLRRHPVLIIFTCVALALAGYTANTWYERQQATGSGGRGWGGATTVVTAKAGLQTLRDAVESIGTAQANESVNLTAKVTDTVSRVHFEDGQQVQAGDILVELTSIEETAQLAEARATLNEAERQYERLQNLIAQNLASPRQLDEERARQQTANARLEAIVARLDDRLVRAPFDGVLGFRNVSPGTLLSPSTIITTLDDISVIKLDFSIPENFLSVTRVGQPVTASSIAWPDREFTGTVRTLNSRVDPITRTVGVRAHIDNAEGLLRPGMLLTVTLTRNEREALVIPEEAVIPIQDHQFVYRVTPENRAERVTVTIGQRVPGFVEVLTGIAAGDEIITQGVIKVRPGGEIRRKGDAPPGGRGGPGGRPGGGRPGP